MVGTTDSFTSSAKAPLFTNLLPVAMDVAKLLHHETTKSCYIIDIWGGGEIGSTLKRVLECRLNFILRAKRRWDSVGKESPVIIGSIAILKSLIRGSLEAFCDQSFFRIFG